MLRDKFFDDLLIPFFDTGSCLSSISFDFFLYFQLTKTDKLSDVITLEEFQSLAIKGSIKHNLPFFKDEGSLSQLRAT